VAEGIGDYTGKTRLMGGPLGAALDPSDLPTLVLHHRDDIS